MKDFCLCILCRKSILDKNKTTTVYQDTNTNEEEVDLVLWLWNAFMSWAFEETPDQSVEHVADMAQTASRDMDTEKGVDDESHNVDESWSWNVIVSEEEHLEYFYLVSTLFLLYIVFIIIQKHNQVSNMQLIEFISQTVAVCQLQ